MNFEIVSSLETHFLTQWADRTLIVFEGSNVKTPETGLWVRYTVRMIQPYQREIGGDQVKIYTPGRIYLNAFCPIDMGNGPAIRLADQAAQIYDGLRLVGFQDIGIPSVTGIGESGKWQQANMEVGFEAVEQRTRPQ